MKLYTVAILGATGAVGQEMRSETMDRLLSASSF